MRNRRHRRSPGAAARRSRRQGRADDRSDAASRRQARTRRLTTAGRRAGSSAARAPSPEGRPPRAVASDALPGSPPPAGRAPLRRAVLTTPQPDLVATSRAGAPPSPSAARGRERSDLDGGSGRRAKLGEVRFGRARRPWDVANRYGRGEQIFRSEAHGRLCTPRWTAPTRRFGRGYAGPGHRPFPGRLLFDHCGRRTVGGGRAMAATSSWVRCRAVREPCRRSTPSRQGDWRDT
jgi:hypothetical protein